MPAFGEAAVAATNAATCFRGGLQWYTQVSSYPRFRDVPDAKFAAYHFDDFAFGAAGNLSFTTVVDQTVERVAPDGRVMTSLAGSDELDMPAAVAFGVLGADRTRLYVTNAASWSPPGTAPRASLLRCDMGRPGAPLPTGAER